MVAEKSIKEIKAEIEEIRSSLPAHSIPPSILIRLEELEEQLESIEKMYKGEEDAAA
jgi:hypothetical protein